MPKKQVSFRGNKKGLRIAPYSCIYVKKSKPLTVE